MLAADDLEAARRGADELEQIAADNDAPLLSALAASTTGAVLVAEQDAGAALQALRRALVGWGELKVPYEAARTQVVIGLACRQCDDEDTARVELEAARRTFDQLGALPDARRVRDLTRASTTRRGVGLTARQLEVLGLVSKGLTNREIAAELVISERTVARHLNNIFLRLGVSSRTAAAAFAFEHELV